MFSILLLRKEILVIEERTSNITNNSFTFNITGADDSLFGLEVELKTDKDLNNEIMISFVSNILAMICVIIGSIIGLLIKRHIFYLKCCC
jgi:hypothetical protein